MKLKDTCSLEEKIWQPRQHIIKQRHYFANKGPSSQSYGFSSVHVWMWELDHKESWAPKNWCFRAVVLEKTLKGPLDSKEVKPVNPRWNQPWILVVFSTNIFNGKTDAEALILWPPDVKNWLIGKDPDARQCIKNRDNTLLAKVCVVKAMCFFFFPKESWVPKNWCFWTMVLEKILECLVLQGDQTIQS